MALIYKIYNDINSKVYIGKTVSTLEERWSKHQWAMNHSNGHLQKAMRKYGIEHFNITIIEDNIPEDQLDEREIYWIKQYNSFYKGYNSTLGGEGRVWIDRKKVKELYLQGLSAKEIANELQVTSSAIIDVLKELKLYSKEEIAKRKAILNGKIQSFSHIYQYTEDLQLVKIYNSLEEAARITSWNKESIRTAIYNQIGYKGYFWIKENDPLPQPRKIKQCISKRIGQYDLEDNLIAIFKNAAEAGRATNSDSSGIIKVCKGHRKTCNKYKWRYIE